MQLFALTSEKELVASSHAFKKQEYFCMECGKSVKLRGGEHRQDHFYHLKPDQACRQSQKSMSHLQVQRHLFNLLKGEDIRLERRFPEISRIGDVVWENQKLVFEVQCSSITQKEVESRNHDYGSIGYQVVWILHERRFLKKRVTAAEIWLQGHSHYFTNFDSEGRGEIFDQLHLFHKGLRCFSSEKTQVNLSNPLEELRFQGDWKSRLAFNDFRVLKIFSVLERERKKLKGYYAFNLWKEIKRWYLNLFYLVLESVSINLSN